MDRHTPVNLVTLLKSPNGQQLADVYADLCRVWGDELTDKYLTVARNATASLPEATTHLNFQAHSQIIAIAVRDAGIYAAMNEVSEEWVRVHQKPVLNPYEAALVLVHGPVAYRDFVYQQ